MNWLAKNWLWFLLALIGVYVGYDLVSSLWVDASGQPATSWFNSLQFWKKGKGNTTGPPASGSGGARNEGAACIPASARVAFCTSGNVIRQRKGRP